MTTSSNFLDAFRNNVSAAAGDVATTQSVLVNAVIDIVNTVTKHGEWTDNKAAPRGQTYWNELFSSLQGLGFEFLGSGYFSIAVAHPALSERVLKVGLKKEDSAAAYTAWCRMNQGRAGVPNVHATKRSTGCYVVVLDELFPLDTDKLREFRGFRAAAAGVHNLHFVVPPTASQADTDKLNALYETGKSIREFFKGLATFDLHTENVMVDKKGNVIITDPVSYTEGAASGSSWCLVDNAAALSDLKREQMALRARERHERNQKRQEIRKAQKERLKAHKERAKGFADRLAQVAAFAGNPKVVKGGSWVVKQSLGFGHRAEMLKMADDNMKQLADFCLFDVEKPFVAPHFAAPEGFKVAPKFNPQLMGLKPRIEWNPGEPLGTKLGRMRDELLEVHTKLNPEVIKQINGLDHALDAQFFRG